MLKRYKLGGFVYWCEFGGVSTLASDISSEAWILCSESSPTIYRMFAPDAGVDNPWAYVCDREGNIGPCLWCVLENPHHICPATHVSFVVLDCSYVVILFPCWLSWVSAPGILPSADSAGDLSPVCSVETLLFSSGRKAGEKETDGGGAGTKQGQGLVGQIERVAWTYTHHRV